MDVSKAITTFMTPQIKPGDTYNEEGLLICGVCNEPKQFIGDLYTGGKVKVNCPCRCDREEDERFMAQMKAQQTQRNRVSAFPANSEYIQATFDKAETTPAIERSKKYVDNFEQLGLKDGYGIIYYGHCGTGKSYAAACVVNAVIDKGFTALYTSIPRIINKMQATWEGKDEYLNELCKVDLLVIDDLTAERQTEYAKEIVYEVIDGRYNTGKPLIISTNLSREQIRDSDSADIATARILSRILQNCVPIEVTGQDRRKEAARVNYNRAKEMMNL